MDIFEASWLARALIKSEIPPYGATPVPDDADDGASRDPEGDMIFAALSEGFTREKAVAILNMITNYCNSAKDGPTVRALAQRAQFLKEKYSTVRRAVT